MAEQGGGVAAVERALALLAVFRDRDEGLTLAELAVRTGLYKSTILRLAASLQKFGYLRRHADGRYAVGPEPLRLAQLYQSSFNLADVVRPLLRRLAEESGETASYYVRDGEERVCVFRAEPRRIVRVSLHEGDRLPLDRGAGGKLFRALAGARGAAFEEIRRQQYAVSYGERDPETAAIACPVYGHGGDLRGALNLSGIRERFTPKHVGRLRQILGTAATELSRLLGATEAAINRKEKVA